MRDHEIAQLVNALRDVAIQHHGSPQLRERIAHLIRPFADSQAKSATPASFDVHLDAAAVETLNVYSEKDTDGDEWPGLRLQLGNGHSGHGLYLSLSEYPEEGSELLTAIPSTDGDA